MGNNGEGGDKHLGKNDVKDKGTDKKDKYMAKKHSNNKVGCYNDTEDKIENGNEDENDKKGSLTCMARAR